MKHFLHQFGKTPQGDVSTLNRQLLKLLRSFPEFEGFDTLQMMMFLYENMPPKKIDMTPSEVQANGRLSLSSTPITPPINNHFDVFISYSHEDKEDFDRLLVHLKAAKSSKTIKWWDDTQIKPGEKWNDAIKKAVASSHVAILLVSVDYLASEFIWKEELPLLLSAEEEGVTILPVILGPCNFQYTNLARFQSVNNPAIPLSKMNKHEKDEVWNKVVETILRTDNS